MFWNYIKIAVRQFTRRKSLSFINVFGLALGLAACLSIGMYVNDELSYDGFHEKEDRLYRVLREFDIPDLSTTIEATPGALAEALTVQQTEFERSIRASSGSPTVKYQDMERIESGYLYTEDGFFEMFSFPLTQGSAQLDRPGTVVISESSALRYFQQEDPIGKSLTVYDQEYEVTGVFKDVPAQSSLQFDFVSPLTISSRQLNWGFNSFTTYVLLREGTTAEQALQGIESLITQNVPPYEGGGNTFIPHLQPIKDIHFGQGVDVDIEANGNIVYVYLFILLAAFILLLACINFVNLKTARSIDRAREVGLRKSIGAHRYQLYFQFIGEAIFLCTIALVVAMGITYLVLPALNSLTGKSMAFVVGPEWGLLLGIVVIIGTLTGSYPALVLSRFQSAAIIKGNFGRHQKSKLRKVLVTLQFAISVGLIACTLIVLQQLRFMKNTDLGFDSKPILVIQQANYLRDNLESFSAEVLQVSGVEQVSTGFSVPGSFFINSMWQPVGPDTEPRNLDYSFVGFDYIEALGIDMVAGRSFNQRLSTDSSAVLLNEAAAQRFGWSPREAIGRQITQGNTKYTVAGVTEDVHFQSLHAEIYPIALFPPIRQQRYLIARLSDSHPKDVLESIQSLWATFSDLPLTYSYLEDDLTAKYQAEQRLFRVFVVFSLIAMLIGCLGLLGLTTYMIEKRRKEIGIRKVLGASLKGITTLLSREFVVLFCIGFVLVSPMAYIAMNRWLEFFAYRTEINLWVFFIAGLTALSLALLSTSYFTIRAALANPVESLRYE